jgi:two-component system, chemotaxis family, sensor kinase CheA
MSEPHSSDSLLDVYLHENSQLLDQLEKTILDCEHTNTYSTAAINEIFRIMHTIKGSSTMMQYTNIGALSHVIEDLFAYIRERKLRLDDYSALSDLVLEGGDFMKLELLKIKNGEDNDGDESNLVNRIREYLEELKGKLTLRENRPLLATVYFEDDCGMENIRAYQVVHGLEELKLRCTYQPANILEDQETAELIKRDGFRIEFDDDEHAEQIQQCLSGIPSIKRYDIGPKPVSGQPPESSAGDPQTEASPGGLAIRESASSSYISVNVQKLDELMDLVGELVIAESMVTQNPELEGQELEQFRKAARQLRKITSEIQQQVMGIRMVPLTGTFQRMNRVVRDMCKKQDKDVRLALVGEDTEVDKNIIEHISDPIMHLVRNAVDHGIETPEERLALGKPAAATVTLEASNVGSEVMITIQDDGRGLNTEKILQRALDYELLTKPEKEMTDREIYQLIFLPGFSTKETITEFSGRGVGMDVVMRNIESVGGTVSVDSVRGRGATITIRIPLTLAIIDGMNVKVGQARYTIPTTAIKQSFRAQPKDIVIDPDGNEMIMVRGECISVLRLYERYGVATDVVEMDEGILIMVEQENAQLCVFADELLGQ